MASYQPWLGAFASLVPWLWKKNLTKLCLLACQIPGHFRLGKQSCLVSIRSCSGASLGPVYQGQDSNESSIWKACQLDSWDAGGAPSLPAMLCCAGNATYIVVLCVCSRGVDAVRNIHLSMAVEELSAISEEVRISFQGPGAPSVAGVWPGGLELCSPLTIPATVFKWAQTLSF